MVIRLKGYTDTPGGRYETDWEYSGVWFRGIIDKTLKRLGLFYTTFIVDISDTAGCTAGFIEECFGGLVRECGYTYGELKAVMSIQGDEGDSDMAWGFIKEADSVGE